jgi:hypothetical protein
MTLKSFRVLNPDWDMYLFLGKGSKVQRKTWKDKPCQDFHSYKGPNYFDHIKDLDINVINWCAPLVGKKNWNNLLSPSHKSNLFKWEKLSNMGGVYSDLDILFTSPIDKFYNSVKSYDTSLSCCPYFSIGLMSSIAPNEFFFDAYNSVFNTWNPKTYQSAGVLSLYDMLSKYSEISIRNLVDKADLFKLLQKKYSSLTLKNIGMSIVYPYDYNNLKFIFSKTITNLAEETLGLHWYAGAPVSQEFNNFATHKNITELNNTFGHFARKIYER